MNSGFILTGGFGQNSYFNSLQPPNQGQPPSLLIQNPGYDASQDDLDHMNSMVPRKPANQDMPDEPVVKRGRGRPRKDETAHVTTVSPRNINISAIASQIKPVHTQIDGKIHISIDHLILKAIAALGTDEEPFVELKDIDDFIKEFRDQDPIVLKKKFIKPHLSELINNGLVHVKNLEAFKLTDAGKSYL